MSQGFHGHQGGGGGGNIYTFSDGCQEEQHQQQQQHIAQQSRRDKLRVQQQGGFDPPLVPIEEGDHDDQPGGIYESATGTGNMLSDMFNFATAGSGVPTATQLLASQMQHGGYQLPPQSSDLNWYNSINRQGMVLGGSGGTTSSASDHFGDHTATKQLINADKAAAAAMQLFLMNPQQQPRSPSSSPPAAAPPHHQALLHHHHHQALIHQNNNSTSGGHFGVVESHHQGLSLSLSSSLQPAAAAADHHQELRLQRDGVLYFNQAQAQAQAQQQQQQISSPLLQQLQGQQSQAASHVGYGPQAAASVGVVNVLRNSKYSRAAQELLEEFCSVGRGQFKGTAGRKPYHASLSSSNPNNATSTSAAAAAGSSPSSKDGTPPSLSPADRFEHQRKKSKLISMLDEVDRRYNHYCEQMQMVVNSFDSVMGFGAATPYTALAQKAMSRHFRCLKDSVATQLRQACEVLGEKEAGTSSGITKGETPRLRLLDQSLRQQRAFHQMGMMEQEAWRPQRGLPERSVTVLRAWLFEHFLHPYPSDADKHLLARQTGLSRNQVANWFINARVRLWKPMVEEMYQQESKDGDGQESEQTRDDSAAAAAGGGNNQISSQSTTHPLHNHQTLQVSSQNHIIKQQQPIRPADMDSLPQRFSSDNNNTSTSGPAIIGDGPSINPFLPSVLMDPPPDLCGPHDELYREYGAALGPAARMRLGTAGDVSLTLGLRHAGNAPEKNRPFTIRDFGR